MKTEVRLKNFQVHLDPQTAVLLSKPADIIYFVDFGFLVPEEREAFLLITKSKATLFHHSFSPTKKNNFCQYVAGINPEQLGVNLKKQFEALNIKRLLIDKTNLVVGEWESLSTLSVKIEALSKDWLGLQKMSKDQNEVEKMTKAGAISAQAFAKLRRKIKVGQTEQEIAQNLKEILKKLGSEQEAFPTIVAFGENSALPHHQPTDKKLETNQAVLIDFGATNSGYRSDMTRSFWFGPNPSKEYQEVLKTVKKAYQMGVKTLSLPSITASQIDRAVRNYITKAQYGEYFIHTTGHGLGIEIHEAPSIYLTNHTVLPNNCVITIEPGIYLTGKYGVRYENTLLLQDGQVSSLTGK